MKSISVLFLIFSLLLVGNFSNARKVMEQGEYWRNMMNGQPMPKAIKDLLVQDHPQVLSNNAAGKKGHFTRDFDIKTNVILYHTHHTESKNNKQMRRHNPSKLLEPQGKAILHG